MTVRAAGTGCALALCGLLGACGSVSSRLDDGPVPARVAVLPFAGRMPIDERDTARELLVYELRSKGLAVLQTDATDRLLSEAGWLVDPATFSPATLAPAALCELLDADACVLGTDFDDRSVNLLLVRRHALGGTLAAVRGDGTTWWTAEHSATSTGGFLLQSGQVFAELRAQGRHGTPVETLALLDQFVSEVAATLPMRARTAAGTEADGAEADGAAGAGARGASGLHGAKLDRATAGVVRVTATAPATAMLWFDVQPGVSGVPMARVGDRWVGAADAPAGATVQLRARSGFEQTTEAVEVAR